MVQDIESRVGISNTAQLISIDQRHRVNKYVETPFLYAYESYERFDGPDDPRYCQWRAVVQADAEAYGLTLGDEQTITWTENLPDRSSESGWQRRGRAFWPLAVEVATVRASEVTQPFVEPIVSPYHGEPDAWGEDFRWAARLRIHRGDLGQRASYYTDGPSAKAA